jgi:hypothetical protein
MRQTDRQSPENGILCVEGCKCDCGSVAGCIRSQNSGVCLSKIIRKLRRCGDREEQGMKGRRKREEQEKIDKRLTAVI